MAALVKKYNEKADMEDFIKIDDALQAGGDTQRFQIPCRIAIVSNKTDGKFDKWSLDETVMMEYKHFFNLLSLYIPPGPLKENYKFRTWLRQNGKELTYRLADYLMVALPSPRVDWYKDNDYAEV